MNIGIFLSGEELHEYTRCWMLDTGFWILDSGFGYLILDAGYRKVIVYQ
jgi:hypothetical protein